MSSSNLPADFKNPPISARPGAFWPWLNANADRERIRYDLQQMKDKGMSGAEIWDVEARRNIHMVPAGPEFLSPESASRIRFALDEAKKLGLRMGLITSSGWNAGGTWVKPDWASKLLASSSMPTTGPVEFSGKLPFPEVPEHCPKGPDGLPLFYLDVAVLAVPAGPGKTVKPEQIIDLTAQLQPDGTLAWDVPAGGWEILRFVCTNTGQELIVPSPNSEGLFIDFLDPEATRRHLQTIMDRLEITPENAADSGLHYLEVDSMELHKGNPWTDRFPGWFKKYRGYDLRQWLPALAGWTVKTQEASEAFLYDYRKTVSDLLIHSHYETGSEFLKEYGMDFVGEAGGPGPPIWDTCPVDALKALGNVTIPRGEFWVKHRDIFLVKEIASAAHIYGKPIVDAESFTTWRRWEDSAFALKVIADRAFAEGLNHITIHTFAHSPDAAGMPGWVYHAGIDINPNVTWWPYARPFIDYLARCSFLLQQGLPVADVLWYYGDQAPNFFPKYNEVPEKPRLPGLGRGYDFDVINSDVILNRLKVENGRFVLPEGTSYRVLAFPDNAAMPLEVLQKLEEFVEQGGIIVGNPPKQEPGLHKRESRSTQMREIADRLWGDTPTSGAKSVGKGLVYTGVTLDDVLSTEGVQEDFSVKHWGEKLHIDYIHRRTADKEIYFVRNASLEPEDATVSFRVTGRTPQLWDPATGDLQACRSYKINPDNVTVDLQLDPGGSTFVVFSDAPTSASAAMVETGKTALKPDSAWKLSFQEDRGAPTSVTLEHLKSWTEMDDPAIRFFSGIGEYLTKFTADNALRSTSGTLMLDLGKVYDIAEVLLNGKPVGVRWKPPYRIDVTGLLKPGTNTLTVRVVNLWHNRLVGDANLPAGERITQTNQPLEIKKNAKLLPAGLLGPIQFVRMTAAEKKK